MATVGGGVERTRLGIFPLSLTGQEDKALGLGWLEREAGWAPYVGERERASSGSKNFGLTTGPDLSAAGPRLAEFFYWCRGSTSQ